VESGHVEPEHDRVTVVLDGDTGACGEALLWSLRTLGFERARAKPLRSLYSDIYLRRYDKETVMSVLEAPFRLPDAPARSDLVAKYFRGFGDPTRVRILELLRDEGELSVGELVDRLGVPQPKVSNHLACLRWCGFIDARREHRTVYNRIADKRVVKMLGLAQALLDDNAEHVAACCRIDQR
jgi:ArsR family transcriptional regulator, cadmium/lead-responsive transcriptional repressor